VKAGGKMGDWILHKKLSQWKEKKEKKAHQVRMGEKLQ